MEKLCNVLPFSEINGHQACPIWEDWHDRLPIRPLCADHFADGTTRRPRTAALGYRHIELNPPGRVAWLCFDIDRSDAIFAADEGDLPEPNMAMVNPCNGHAHLAYALEAPVGIAGRSRMGPIGLLRDVESGMIRRLGADPSYVGRFAKTPNHPAWKTVWLTPKPFALGDLIERVGPRSEIQLPHRQELIGHSRNVELFDATREVAYREFASFELRVGHLKAWSDRVLEIATAWNCQFELPLPPSEVRSIAKSIAVWTWRHFSPQEFSQIQSNRAKRGNQKRGIATRRTIKVISEEFSITGSI